MADINRHIYENRQALAGALAATLAGVLADAIATRSRAFLAVSGGSTPKLFFKHLSQADIDWSKVTVLLVDERIVPPDHERANAGLVRANLLQNAAAAARFIPYTVDAATPEACAEASQAAFELADNRIDAVVLGMGTDGHTASFFPQGDRLFSAINLETKQNVISMNAPGAGEPRLTLTLPCLLEARFLALHIEGAEKQTVLEKALVDEETMAMPVRAVLHQKVAPVDIFWAP